MALIGGKPSSRLVRILRLLVPALAILCVLLARGVRAQAPTPSVKPAASSQPSAMSSTRSSPEKVLVGLYLQNIPDVDIKTNSFAAEFYLWFLWEGEIDPTLTFELTNVVNVTELTKIPVYVDANGASAPDTLPDGRHIQQFHCYGRFGHPFPLGKYPFDDHEIVISMEDARHSIPALVYEIDAKGTAMRPDLSIPGWNLSAMESKLGQTKFATTFGDPRSGKGEESYSRVSFSMRITRPVVGIISKTVVPIAIIILITFGAFFCQPSDIDARLCLTITALMSAVALQFTAATELPPTGSLLLLDKIYILSYLAILAVTFCCIGANRYVHADRPEAATRLDRVALWSIAGTYFGCLLLFLARAR